LVKFVWNTLHIEHVGYEIDESDHNYKKKNFLLAISSMRINKRAMAFASF